MYDVIVVGAGPAGISAGINAKRGNLNVLIIYNSFSELEKADKIDNYYGFPGGISGKELYERGILQAKNLGIELKELEILDLEVEEDSSFLVKSKEEVFSAKALVIATGNKKIKPNIKGLEDFEGKGISYCAICDGFFYRNKNVVVLGNGDFAVNEAKLLKNIVGNLKILTNGLEISDNNEFEYDTRKIIEIHGDKKVTGIEFADGEILNVDGIFIAQGVAGGIDFSRKLGIATENNAIVVDKNMQTNIKGIYACGDIAGGLFQISKAVCDGAIAGIEVVKYIKNI